jgi:hypothetical protein
MAAPTPLKSETIMSSKHPTDTTALNASASEHDVEPNSAAGDTIAAAELSLLEKVQLAKSRQRLNKPDPRSVFKGPRIGNGPNGSRRSMGKR